MVHIGVHHVTVETRRDSHEILLGYDRIGKLAKASGDAIHDCIRESRSGQTVYLA